MKLKSVCIIIENEKNQILLLLRDNKSSIQFPNQWVTLGGQIENNESPEEAIVREIKEEIEVSLINFKLVRVYDWPEKTEYVYHTKLDIDLNKITLHEGQEVRFFSKEEIENMNLAFHDNKILEDYLNS